MNSNDIGLKNVNFFKKTAPTNTKILTTTHTNNDEKIKHGKNLSKRMPPFLKKLILFITQYNSFKKCTLMCTPSGLISILLYLLTLISGCIYLISNVWLSVANGLAKETKTTLLSESANIILTFIWFSLGTYPIKIINYLYRTKTLEESIRLRTKSYFKIPASLILIVLTSGFLYTLIEFIQSKKDLSQKINIPHFAVNLIYYFNFIYTIIAVAWNFLVGLTIMFILRTYTISLRRFLYYLEQDSLNISKISYYFDTHSNRITCQSLTATSLTPSNQFVNYDNDDDEDDEYIVEKANYQVNQLNNQEEIHVMDSFKLDISLNDIFSYENCTKFKLDDIRSCEACQARFLKQATREIKMFACEHIQRTNSIFQVYWNYANNFRIFSRLTQRWMISIISIILIWCLSCLIKWINNKEPSLTSIIEFGSPLLALAVLCGSYAEANAEANRIIPTIYPLEERILMLNYIKSCLLKLNIYGFVVDYSAEVKFIGAFAVGFLSQIIFHEFND